MIEGPTQLRFLELPWNMEISNQVRFVKLISGMKFLQTLDLRGIEVCDLSDFTWGTAALPNLPNLRTLVITITKGFP